MVTRGRTIEPPLILSAIFHFKEVVGYLKVYESGQIEHEQDRAAPEDWLVHTQIFDWIRASFAYFAQRDKHQWHYKRLHHNRDPGHGWLGLLAGLLDRVEYLVDRVSDQDCADNDSRGSQALPHTRQPIVGALSFQSQIEKRGQAKRTKQELVNEEPRGQDVERHRQNDAEN